MSFLDRMGVATPEELREAVRRNAAAQAGADQIEAERSEVRALAPAENDFLRDELAAVVHRALTTMDESHDYEGSAPVLTVSPFGYTPSSAEHTREGTSPIERSAVRACHSCVMGHAHTVPFWLAVGRHVLQADLCPDCAVAAIDRGARPQNLTIPDVMPDDLA